MGVRIKSIIKQVGRQIHKIQGRRGEEGDEGEVDPNRERKKITVK